jgi:hypothetical protein
LSNCLWRPKKVYTHLSENYVIDSIKKLNGAPHPAKATEPDPVLSVSANPASPADLSDEALAATCKVLQEELARRGKSVRSY